MMVKKWVPGTPYPIHKCQTMFHAHIYGHINWISVISYCVRWVGPAIIPKNGDSYLSHEKTNITTNMPLCHFS